MQKSITDYYRLFTGCRPSGDSTGVTNVLQTFDSGDRIIQKRLYSNRTAKKYRAYLLQQWYLEYQGLPQV